MIHFGHKSKEGLFFLGERRAFQVVQNLLNQFLAAKQFRRNCSVIFRSKRAMIAAGCERCDQFPETRTYRRLAPHRLLGKFGRCSVACGRNANRCQIFGYSFPLASCNMPAYVPGNRLYFEILAERRNLSASLVPGLSGNQRGAHFKQGTSSVYRRSAGDCSAGAGCSHQGTCAVALDTMLRQQKGVIRSRSRYPEGTVWIEFEPKSVTDSSLRSFIAEMGLRVEGNAPAK